MVGLQILDLPIGVRVPVSQPLHLRSVDSKLVLVASGTDKIKRTVWS
jgi:hypothetical protein